MIEFFDGKPFSYLSHGGKEALRVEESRHPEHIWPSLENPTSKLLIAFQEFGIPETECGGIPRNLKTSGLLQILPSDWLRYSLPIALDV